MQLQLKGNFSKLLKVLLFKTYQCMREYSGELQNAGISTVSLLISDSTTKTLPAILRCPAMLTGIICSGVSLEYTYYLVIDWTGDDSFSKWAKFSQKIAFCTP